MLKFDDEKALDQIDAVFVTLEPDGQSHKPADLDGRSPACSQPRPADRVSV